MISSLDPEPPRLVPAEHDPTNVTDREAQLPPTHGASDGPPAATDATTGSEDFPTTQSDAVETTPAAARLENEGPPFPVEDPGSTRPVGTVAFGFNLEKIAGHGEDSDPLLHAGADLAIVAVFDGMGGAGGTVYQTPDGPFTGAYLASRTVRDVVGRRLRELLDTGLPLDGPAVADDLRRFVEGALVARLADLNAPRSALRSKLIRALPTTMALAVAQRQQPDGPTWTCDVWWAGDSRIYVVEPESGAAQLTVDDIRDHGDAMANLHADSVLDNAISADIPFTVHHRQSRLTAPFLLIAATDGCFGYLPTPMHFEHLILDSLGSAPGTAAWSATVQAHISGVTGDDAAMALYGAGADFDGFRTLFDARRQLLNADWVQPLDEVAAEIDRRRTELNIMEQENASRTSSLWSAYKPGYERYIGTSRPETGAT